MIRPPRLCLTLALSLAFALAAKAQVVTVTDRNVFNTLTTSQDVMAFDGTGYSFNGAPVQFQGNGPFADGSGTYRLTNGTNTATLWNGPVTLTNNTGSGRSIGFAGPSNSGVEIVDSGNIGTPGNAVLVAQGSVGALDGITLTLPAGAFDAVGLDLRMVTNSAQATNYSISVNGIPAAIVPTTDTAFQFVGLISPSPITTVTITQLGIGGAPILDNITTASPAAVPEPSTLSLLGLAGIFLSQFLRKKA